MNKLNCPSPQKIAHLEADINYTIFHFKDGNTMVTAYTLKRFQSLPALSGFKRISRKFLVNPDEVKEIKRESGKEYVVLKDGKELKISRRRTF